MSVNLMAIERQCEICLPASDRDRAIDLTLVWHKQTLDRVWVQCFSGARNIFRSQI